MGIFDDIAEAGQGLVSGFDDAVKDITGTITDQVVDGVTNLVDAISGIPSDMADFLQDLPGRLLDAVVKMLHDPKFWIGIMAFMGLTVAAGALGKAMTAAPGARWAAFTKEAGILYHGSGLSFINKAHRIGYLLSPTYRTGFQEKFLPQIQQLSDAGVDIGTAAMLIGDVMSLSRSVGSMFGADWEASRDSWDSKMSQFGEAIAENAQSWGDDPNALFEWLDENLVAPEQNRAAGFFNRVNTGLSWITDKGEQLFSNLNRISEDMQRVSDDLKVLGYQDLAEQFEEGSAGVGQLFAAEWDYLKKTFDSVGEILRTKTRQAVQAAGTRSDGKGLIMQSGAILKRKLGGI